MEFEDSYDRIFFELLTDLAFMPNESKQMFNQSVEYVNIKIYEMDEKIAELEQYIFTMSVDCIEKWLIRLQDLQDKRNDLLVKTRAEIETQKNSFQVLIDSIEEQLANYKVEDLQNQILYHTGRRDAFKENT
ncbi:hypothetical protein [Chryseobacterium sp. CCH4-E10]|uniref:hypothetical protein n=1 Tax=Chryseobacterium sp. CCH4-E10 TaxID=1768758 RepID=UPI0012F7824B|nr:hypothetical protein [Chryseobacterium sp. CCH4-E10]